MALFWHRGSGDSPVDEDSASRKVQQLAELAPHGGWCEPLAAARAEIARPALFGDDLRNRGDFAGAQALAADNEVAQVIKQPIVDVVFGCVGHTGSL